MRKSSINDNILILLDIMYKSFNYKLDFKSWSKKEFLKFTKDFINFSNHKITISPPAFSISLLAPALKAEAEIFIFLSNDPLPRILTGLRDERIRPEFLSQTGSIIDPSLMFVISQTLTT